MFAWLHSNVVATWKVSVSVSGNVRQCLEFRARPPGGCCFCIEQSRIWRAYTNHEVIGGQDRLTSLHYRHPALVFSLRRWTLGYHCPLRPTRRLM